jgi:hypothetical protein
MEQVIEVQPAKKKTLLMPEEAAQRLIPKFKRMARNLRPRDPHLRADLIQEMCLACLSIHIPMTLTTYCSHALRRALDYLEKEERSRRLHQDYKELCRR